MTDAKDLGSHLKRLVDCYIDGQVTERELAAMLNWRIEKYMADRKRRD